MTLHATRDGQSITIHGNTGTEVLVKDGKVWHVRITENAQHVRFFHDQLGKLLNAADEERHATEHPETEHHATPHEGHGHHGGYGTGAPE